MYAEKSASLSAPLPCVVPMSTSVAATIHLLRLRAWCVVVRTRTRTPGLHLLGRRCKARCIPTSGDSMQQVKAVVALGQGEPVQLTTINVPDPGPGEAVVQVQACGVCHTDLHYREGGINDEFPFLLGHEAAGFVESVGPDVTGLEPGDFVVLNWRAVCGDCPACNRGEPWYCFATFNATQRMTLAEGDLAGTELSPALGIGAFAEKTLVAAGQCTKVDPAARPAAVGLLGCGVMAGLGAAINTGNVTRGKSVAVIGCGGVGVAAIAGSALAGASPIIAVDIDAKKLEKAKAMGATHTVDSSQV